MRLCDQPRPVAWQVLRFVSPRYRNNYESRHMPAGQRVLLRKTFYLPEIGAVYIRNPKVASSSIVRLLERAEAAWSAAGEAGRFLYPPMSDWRLSLKALEDDKVYKFTFVRHPAARAVSTFNNFFARRVRDRNAYWWRHQWWLWRRGGRAPRYGDHSVENFDRFLGYAEEVLAGNAQFCDEHFRLQVMNTHPDLIRYDAIGKIETIAQDLERILQESGLGAYARATGLGQENRAAGTLSVRELTDRQFETIHRLYKPDYDAFGYDIRPPG